MAPFWSSQHKKIQRRPDKDKAAARREAACREEAEDAVPSIASTTQHSSAEGSIEVTVSSRKDPAIRPERSTEENAKTSLPDKEASTAELYRFGMAFGWAKGVAPSKFPHTVADLSATAQQHYAALQVWKGQHAAFLHRPQLEKDPDAADAQEWQQALDYAYRHEILRLASGYPPVKSSEVYLGLGNRVVMAPHGMMPRHGKQKHHHRVLYVLPAGLDFHVPVPHGHPHAKTALMDWYTTALALYLYRTLVVRNSNPDNGDPDVTIVLDVRSGGPAWPNPGVLTLLPFIRHVSRVLPRVLPHRVCQVLVGPLPGWACQLHHWAVAPLLPATLRLTLLAGPSTAATAILPSALAQHLRGDDEEPVARLEALRRAAIRERRNGS